jgi:hypothetical protein
VPKIVDTWYIPSALATNPIMQGKTARTQISINARFIRKCQMPDSRLAIANHNKTMQQWWKIPVYRKARIAFVIRNPICIRCGRKATTPGHSHEDYHSFDTYLAAVVEDCAEPLCNACNLAEKKGLRPCPECVKEKKTKIRYIRSDQEYCYDHRPEEEKRQSEERKEVFKMLVKKSQKITNAKRRAIYQEMKKR